MRERVDSQDGEQDGGHEGARDVELVLASSGADQRCANSVRSIATSSRLRTGASSRRATGGNVVEEEEQKFSVRRQPAGAAVGVVQEEVGRLEEELGAEDEDSAEQLVQDARDVRVAIYFATSVLSTLKRRG